MSLIDTNKYLLKAGRCFRNVTGGILGRGSSDDVLPPGVTSWIAGWENVTEGNRNVCCVCKKTSNERNIIGAHIVLGDGSTYGNASDESSDLEYGDRVFIAPLCDKCNQCSGTMYVVSDTPIMHLWEYLYDTKEDYNIVGDLRYGKNGYCIDDVDEYKEEWNEELNRYRFAALDDNDMSYLKRSAAARASQSLFSFRFN